MGISAALHVALEWVRDYVKEHPVETFSFFKQHFSKKDTPTPEADNKSTQELEYQISVLSNAIVELDEKTEENQVKTTEEINHLKKEIDSLKFTISVMKITLTGLIISVIGLAIWK